MRSVLYCLGFSFFFDSIRFVRAIKLDNDKDYGVLFNLKNFMIDKKICNDHCTVIAVDLSE